MDTIQLTAPRQRYQVILLDADNEAVCTTVVDASSHELLDMLYSAATWCIDIVC